MDRDRAGYLAVLHLCRRAQRKNEENEAKADSGCWEWVAVPHESLPSRGFPTIFVPSPSIHPDDHVRACDGKSAGPITLISMKNVLNLNGVNVVGLCDVHRDYFKAAVRRGLKSFEPCAPDGLLRTVLF